MVFWPQNWANFPRNIQTFVCSVTDGAVYICVEPFGRYSSPQISTTAIMPVLASHSRTVRSSEADAKIWPSGKMAERPSSVPGAMPVLVSHSRTVRSIEAEARIWPLGENVTARSQPGSPSSVCKSGLHSSSTSSKFLSRRGFDSSTVSD